VSGSAFTQTASTTVVGRAAPATAPTVVEGAASGGSFTPGNFAWKVTFIYNDGSESLAGPATSTLTSAGTKKWDFSNIPIGDARVTQRRIYASTRATGTPDFTDTGGSNTFTQQTVSDNSTTALTFDFGTTGSASNNNPPATTPGYSPGSTYLYVADTSIFSASGGTVTISGQTITYTGRSTSSGVGALTGIPASGPGSIVSTISLSVTASPVYTAGLTALPVTDTAQFFSGGGSVQVSGQILTYTGRSTSSGAGSLTGIPSGGAGSITSTIAQGATVSVVYPSGSTTLTVTDTAVFSASGGSVIVAGQLLSYTGRSTSSGVGSLTGIPASGPGAITSTISGGTTVMVAYAPGLTSLPVADTAAFLAAGGSVLIGDGQTLTFTGRSTSSGAGNLTGIPPTGGGAIASAITGGTSATMVYPAGNTSLTVNDTTSFVGTGGFARVGSQTFSYTGRSTTSGLGALTGIPASGAGALLSAVLGGASVFVGVGGGGTLIGIPSSGDGSVQYAINVGDDVNLRVVIDDAPAQATIGALIGGGDDGVIEGTVIQDGRISEVEARARGKAVVDQRKTLDVGITLVSHDRNLRAGRTLSTSLSAPSVTGSFRVTQVTITHFVPARWPTRQATASSRRFTLEDLLRLARLATEIN
jgi:hypothetical protein